MRIIITVRYHCTAPKMAKKQKQEQTNEKLIIPKATWTQSKWDTDTAV